MAENGWDVCAACAAEEATLQTCFVCTANLKHDGQCKGCKNPEAFRARCDSYWGVQQLPIITSKRVTEEVKQCNILEITDEELFQF
jgi:hypothetical protein